MDRAVRRRKIGGFRRPLLEDERGVALVEFALVLPLVLVLLLGMIDVGKAVNYWNDETHLANEAARYAAVNKNPGPQPTLNQSILDQADTTELKNGGTNSIPSADKMTVCIWFPNKNSPVVPDDYAAGQAVQVVVTAKYHWLGYLVGKGVLPTSTLRATSTMRLEQSYPANTNPANGPTNAYTTGPAPGVADGSGTC